MAGVAAEAAAQPRKWTVGRNRKLPRRKEKWSMNKEADESERRKYQAINSQSRVSRRYMDKRSPSNASAWSTIEAIPPPTYPRSNLEVEIIKRIPAQFNITTPVDVDRLEFLTRHHPNRPFIEYILQGFRKGFRYGFQGKYQSMI